MVDVERLRRSWARVAAFGDQVPLRFYSRLFVLAPETRDMFPLSMTAQRDRLVTALGHTVSHVDDLERLVPYLRQLGRDHRRFGVAAEHYEPVAEALLATLADFLGRDWTADLADDWAEAFGVVAATMIDAAEQAARYVPPWWEAEVVAHERRTFDIAVLTVQPEPHLGYLAGQSLAVETGLRPRLWRYYSPANAPRDDGTLDLHVRRVPGGKVSAALVDQVQKGDVLRLGAPVGNRLTLRTSGDRDLLMIAGGTGLAPLKAVVEEIVGDDGDGSRQVALFVGARTARELYDLEALRALDAEHDWLTVTTVLSDTDPGLHPWGAPEGPELGDVTDVALRHGTWTERDVYVCGSDEMVRASLQLLHDAGHAAERLHYEGFPGLGGQTYGVVDPSPRYQK